MSLIIIEKVQDIKNKEIQERYERLETKFKEVYDKNPTFICRAPGRVNLIGEHIDYCGYSVLPMAIKQDVSIAVKANREGKIRIANINPYFQYVEVDVEEYVINLSLLSWSQYVLCGYKGIEQLKKNAEQTGLDLLVDGTVPRAAGMSSSSALVCASGLAAAVINNQINLNRFHLAEICTGCERFIGTQGGGMDQSIAFLAEQGKAKLIGFNPLTVNDVTLPDQAVFVIANSRVSSEKALTSNFNLRVADCKIACHILAKHLKVDCGKVKNFQDLQKILDVSIDQMLEYCDQYLHKDLYHREEICSILNIDQKTFEDLYLSEKTKNAIEFKLHDRSKHVFSEARRVLKFHSICENHVKDVDVLEELGALMDESHFSCRDLYECSCEQLDLLTDSCRKFGALGSRMTGAGWGGCTVSLVRRSDVELFITKIQEEFFSDVNKKEIAEFLFATSPSNGAAVYMFD